MLLPALGRINELSHRAETDIKSTLAIVALLGYANDKGGYPESLEELVEAGYLEEVPIDAYSNKPVVYKKTNGDFLLYSVGPNFVDDGGIPGKDSKGKIRRMWADDGDTIFWPVSE